MTQGLSYHGQMMEFLLYAQSWLFTHVFVMDSVIQLGLLMGAALFAKAVKGKLQRSLDRLRLPHAVERFEEPTKDILKPLVAPIFLIIILSFCVFALPGFDQGVHIINLVVSLLYAWVVIRFASAFIKDPGWSKLVSVTAWTIAALNIVGLLGVTTDFLDSLSFSFGQMSFSVLGLIKGVIAIAVLFWAFSLLESIIKKRIMALDNITPSAKELLKKFLRVVLIIVGVLIAMDAMGIDLTALAVFSGAIGIGLGFGLQKVAANLVSGVILLLDRSVKPGDVIALGETYGRIDKLGGRYVSVITRDGTEHLIPNEELITQRVENWSFSDTNVRQKAMIGISYKSDVRRAMELCVEAGQETPRIVDDPAPKCLLRDFGDNAVMIELRFWVNDAHNGLRNVRSDVLLRIWDKFHAEGIEIPYPQRDLHVKGTVPVRVEEGEG